MNRVVLALIAWILPLAGAYPQTQSSSSSKNHVAVVDKVRGKVFRNGKPYPLHKGDIISAGWKLSCPKGSTLVLCFFDDKKVTIKPGGKPYFVPHVPRTPGPLASFFEITGREQSPGVIIFSPPRGDRGVVWPDRFVFRWVPQKGMTSIRLILRKDEPGIDDEKPLWAADKIDAASGAYVSQGARAALRRLRESEPDAKVKLTLVTQDEKPHEVTFGLLSSEEEKALQVELSVWQREDGIMRYIGRAFAFSKRRLYTEAAEVYEEALQSSPESVDLRIATIYAHRRTGNTVREAYHRRRLPPGTALPD